MFPAHLFPKLAQSGYIVTSAPDKSYNCIAFAAGDQAKWWWPIPGPAEANAPIVFWPAGAPFGDSLDVFVTSLGLLAYNRCDDPSVDANLVKVALYAIDGRVKHASRQMANGQWRSKMGKAEDIEHSLEAVEGPLYGLVAAILERPAK